MKTQITQKCDVCGEPATSLARDVFRHETEPYITYSTSDTLKTGCDKHPVHSDEHRTELPPSKDWKFRAL